MERFLFTENHGNTELQNTQKEGKEYQVENCQTKKGTVKIPKVLQKYMFGIKEINPK